MIRTKRLLKFYSNTRLRPTPGYRPTIFAMYNNHSISMHNFNELAQHYDDFVLTDGIDRENELHERLDSALHSDCVVTSSLILQDGSSIQCRTRLYSPCETPTNTIDLANHGQFALYICVYNHKC